MHKYCAHSSTKLKFRIGSPICLRSCHLDEQTSRCGNCAFSFNLTQPISNGWPTKGRRRYRATPSGMEDRSAADSGAGGSVTMMGLPGGPAGRCGAGSADCPRAEVANGQRRDD
mmetsp:Transcript_27899/g.58035  ORF Transcript_27899/g.58035 Transcript_27899/m.58035 type:complete len:114 (+) Transcript_27899:1903-2244(+)